METISWPLVKVTRRYQVTIPDRLRKELPLDIWDMLEVTIRNWEYVFSPKRIMGKKDLEKKFDDIFKNSPTSKKSEKEIMQDVMNEIKLYRNEKYKWRL